MNADAIIEKIMSDARAEASKALSGAKEHADQMNAELDRALAGEREASLKRARADGEQLRERMLRVAELDERKERLAVKRDVIDAAFDDALARMRAMGGDDERKYFMSLITEAAEGGESIVVSGEDAKLLDAGFMKRLNETMARSGRKPLELSSERRALGGGLVLTSGGMEVNLTYAAVLKQLRPSLEAEVAQVLFG